VYSSRYAGLAATDAENIEKLLKNLHNVPQQKRTARFRCILILMGPRGFEKVVQGTCEGSIGYSSMGTNGFGYDPVFIPAGEAQSFAQMDEKRKNLISHRAQALQQLKEALYAIFR
jgi:XTP/dITP diphosphohydrolase